MISYVETSKEFIHKKYFCCCSVIKSCLTICNPRNYSILGFLSFTISQSLFKLMSIESPNQFILCHPFTSCPQSIPASGSFPMSWLLASGSPCAVASAPALPMNIQGWFPLGLTYLLSKEPSRVFSSTIIQKHQFFSVQSSLWSNSHIHTQLLEKP